MRTTINLPDALAEAARARAAAEGRTFTSLVEQGLRAVLDENPAEITEPLPAFGSAEGAVLIDLDDVDAVWDTLDERDDPGHLG